LRLTEIKQLDPVKITSLSFSERQFSIDENNVTLANKSVTFEIIAEFTDGSINKDA
jgi:hypothetical protein